MTEFSYTSGTTPDAYVCSACSASGVRLYRRYCSSHVELTCTECTQKEQGEPLAQADHSCGWRVAAVPLEADPNEWWGYTSTPPKGWKWWDQLPVK